MKTPEISNCCGFSLKHGAIILGIIQSIIAFIFMILSAAYAENPHELIDMVDPNVVPNLDRLRTILIIIAVFSAFLCAFSIMIIFGAETNRPLLLVPWLLTNPVTVAVYIITTLIVIIHHTPGPDNTLYVVGHVIIAAVLSLIACYNTVAVFSLFRHLRSLNF